MDTKKKLVELLADAGVGKLEQNFLANQLIANGITALSVRHGKWEKRCGIYSCSECEITCPYDAQADVIVYWTCNYCPNCGAKMDK